ncbi:hypothetical protein T439DRAFT_131232 [Meredithblackwellia eburnea MCA 4105]
MCGILVGIRALSHQLAVGETGEVVSLDDELREQQKRDKEEREQLWTKLEDAVKPRGPDSHHTHVQTVTLSTSHGDAVAARDFEVRFHGSVLHMRGTTVTPQPFINTHGDVLLFNGEVFDGLEVPPVENDGQRLFDSIQEKGDFRKALKDVEGPYAIIFYEATTRRMFFARDPLGRRSLLVHKPNATSPFLLISSCGAGVESGLDEWEEVSCDSVFCYEFVKVDFDKFENDGSLKIGTTTFPRVHKSKASTADTLIYPFDLLNPTLPSPTSLPEIPPSPLHLSSTFYSTLETFHTLISLSVQNRVLTVPSPPSPISPTSSQEARIAILFSGGIDCTTIALLVDEVLPEAETVELINVAFENPRKLRGVAVGGGGVGKKVKCKSKDKGKAMEKWKGKEKEKVNGKQEEEVENGVREIAVEDTTASTPRAPQPEPESESPTASIYDVPDRLTGRATFRALQTLRPRRRWKFVEVDVPYQETLEHKQKIVDLMRPNRTVMDYSISLAFYFAARGQGSIQCPLTSTKTPYHSKSRVLLSGLGADELLGGYSRHRKAFFNQTGPDGGDWESLIKEMQMDLDRIPRRNLGRDDRIISFWGKEARYPFLAGPVVEFCARTPIHLKCDPRLGEGVGDKLLVRQLAKSLGLPDEAAGLKKRAIHFGARTAKMEEGSGHLTGDMLLQ